MPPEPIPKADPASSPSPLQASSASPENPQLLLAELEAARLALRARPKPSRTRGILLGVFVLLLLGALALWCLSMMGNIMKKPQPTLSASAKISFASDHAYL